MRLLMWEPVSFSFESFFGDKGSSLWEKKTLSNKVGIYILRADLCRTLDLAFGRTPQSPKDRPQCLLGLHLREVPLRFRPPAVRHFDTLQVRKWELEPGIKLH